MPWEPEYVSWLFDTARIPAAARSRLVSRIPERTGDLFAQDWAAAEAESLRRAGAATDLGWAFDIAGWAAERRGERQLAVQHYLAGLQTSWFSDDARAFARTGSTRGTASSPPRGWPL